MTTEDVQEHLRRRLPAFSPAGTPEPLAGGLLNRVWRVKGTPAPVIVKHAPDHLGERPLDPFRLTIEARALDDLPGPLSSICDATVRPPRLLDFDAAAHALVMEDVGDLPALDAWLRASTPEEAREQGEHLGRFVGRLHRLTLDDGAVAARFDNRPIQQTRLEVQYRGIGASLAAAGVPEADALGARAAALGERLLQPGRCLVMGDLWPRSVLVAPNGLRVIDWEMAHFGQPFQDFAHLAAHLWMLNHRGVSAARDFARGFAAAYEVATSPEIPGEASDAALHAGCEVIVRALGPFRGGYLYEDASPGSAPVHEAVSQALRWMQRGVPRRADLLRLG